MNDEQVQYFKSWHEFLEASCGKKIEVLETMTPAPENGPWLKFPRQWDTIYYHIDGHEIVGSGMYPETTDTIKLTENVGSSHMQHVAAVSDDGRGLTLCVDPRTVRYARRHNGDGADTRPNPAWLLLRNVENFFKEWDNNKEERFFRVFRTIKKERLNWLGNQIEYYIRDVERIKSLLESSKKNLKNCQHAQANLRALTKEKYAEATKNWKPMVESMGKITIPRDRDGGPRGICLEMPAFDINDVELGPFHIIFDLADLELTVTNVGGNKSYEGHHHPHVSGDGEICWGDSPRAIYDVLNRGNPFEILFTVADFLKTSYFPNGAYCRLENWNGDEDSGWYCDFCDEHHPDGDNCPNYCGECEGHVTRWDEHHTCFEHYRCWNEQGLPDEHQIDDPTECPDCRRDRIKEEEEEEAEEEAEAENEEEQGESESEDAPEPPDGYDEECSCGDCMAYRATQISA